MYQFYMTIGDWGGDGHEKSENFLICSNYPVERVREAHFRIRAVTGIDIESICSEFEENEIDEDNYRVLKKMGFAFVDHSGMGEQILSPSDMARLWAFLLQKADPELHLEIVEERTPLLHFLGTDSKGRHIFSVGYGLFK